MIKQTQIHQTLKYDIINSEGNDSHMQIKIKNNIEQKVNEYQNLHGSTKQWIAERVGISKSRMYQIFKSDDMMINVYIRFAIVLNCSLDDLIDFEIINEQ